MFNNQKDELDFALTNKQIDKMYPSRIKPKHIGVDRAVGKDKTVYSISLGSVHISPYCTDRYGCCEENEVCYCNRIECPSPECHQLLPSSITKGDHFTCGQCKAETTIL